MKSRRIGKVCLISPIVAPVLYYIGAASLMVVSQERESSLFGAFIFIMSFGIPVSYLATLLVDMPVYQLLDRKGLLTRVNLVLSGVVLGALVMVLFFSSLSGLDIKEMGQVSIIGAVLGGSVALAFGAIAGITRGASGRSLRSHH